VFVTLERDGRLLGCVGTLETALPLVDAVAYQALAAAFADPRVGPVTAADYVDMSLKVSVLSEPEALAVSSYDELSAVVQVGVDGLVVEVPGGRVGTLLPSVWKRVDTVAAFLEILWRKAGLVPGWWIPTTRVARYTTEEFGSAGPRPRIRTS
jgi:AmmeMemoRadiSam system protein A